MSSFEPTWFLCGGWAVDSWLGRQTRDHGDVDITVFHEDQRDLFDHLAGWHLIAHAPDTAGNTTAPWGGRRLDLPAHIHARPPGDEDLEALHGEALGTLPHDGRTLEILLNERTGEEWLLDTDPPIALPLEQCSRPSSTGLPTVVPEVLMFYKATAYRDLPGYPRPRDEVDFVALIPLLADVERRWLRGAISEVAPEHPWLLQLRE